MITNDNSHEIAKLLKIQKRTHKVSAHQYSSTSQASISDKSTQKNRKESENPEGGAQHVQILREEPKTRATAAVRKPTAKDGEMTEAGEEGLGAGASAA